MKTAEESDTWCPDEPASSLKVSKRSSKRVSYVAADAELSIQNLSFHVESRGHRTSLLQNICAHVKSSEVLAILGGSGAGKTTLLDAVASEARRGHREGEVLLNSHRLNRAVFRRSCAYVAQSDACCPTLTVFETLFLAASLYQGQASCSKHQQDVQTLLGQVGLDSCQHVKVGDGLLIRGVSGGQRRRVSLAVELLKQPSVLVLDEPTSGLDSKAAEAIVELLRKISVANNLATICTIHQPSSYVFQLFDRLLLLAKGRVCYFGLAEEALRHFETLGFPSASGINPADFLLRITNSDFAASAGQVDWICDAWKEAPEAPLLCRELPPGRLRARFLQQVWKLLGRFLKSHCRDPIAFGGRAILTAVLVSFVCVAYIGARKRTQESVLNYLWAMMWVPGTDLELQDVSVDVGPKQHLPAPSNRSPPATFKSPKATRGDLLEGPGIDFFLGLAVARQMSGVVFSSHQTILLAERSRASFRSCTDPLSSPRPSVGCFHILRTLPHTWTPLNALPGHPVTTMSLVTSGSRQRLTPYKPNKSLVPYIVVCLGYTGLC